MTTPTQWNPFRTATHFDPTVDFEDLFRSLSLRPMVREMENAVADLRMDVEEDDTAYRVKVDVPGAKKQDIQVSVEGNQVTIETEVQREQAREDRKQLHIERYVGKSFRAFSLPQGVDSDKCGAQYDNGVLTLTLPKKGNGQGKRLAIN